VFHKFPVVTDEQDLGFAGIMLASECRDMRVRDASLAILAAHRYEEVFVHLFIQIALLNFLSFRL
jgi:hypothetical protein